MRAILQALYEKVCSETEKNCIPHLLIITDLLDEVSKIMGTTQTNPKMHYFGEKLRAAKLITIDEGSRGVIFKLEDGKYMIDLVESFDRYRKK